jgi:hypothetical protein
MLESRARELAHAECGRLNAAQEYSLQIASALSLPGGWVFLTAGHGAERDHPNRVPAIGVHESGRVVHSKTETSADDLKWLVPRSKFDRDRVQAVIALGYPAVGPILPQLLEWLRDMNSPVAGPLSSFLTGIGAPLAPHLRNILNGDDGTWKYWIIGGVIGDSRIFFDLFKDDLRRIAFEPTANERLEEADQRAREVLDEATDN